MNKHKRNEKQYKATGRSGETSHRMRIRIISLSCNGTKPLTFRLVALLWYPPDHDPLSFCRDLQGYVFSGLGFDLYVKYTEQTIFV